MAAGSLARSRWLFHPAPDLLLGCGLAYIGLFAVYAIFGAELRAAVPIGVVTLAALFTGTPHYGATLLRVYDRREDRRAYALFAVWATALIAAIFVCNLADLAIAIYLTMELGWQVMAFAVVGLAMSVFYVAPPLKLKHRGLGEPAIFMIWGPLMIGGTYFVMAGEVTMRVFMLSVPYGLGVMAVLMGKHLDKQDKDRAKGVLDQANATLSDETVANIHASTKDLKALLAQLRGMADEQRGELRQLSRSLRKSAEGVEQVANAEELDRALQRIDSLTARLDETTESLSRSSSSLETVLGRLERGEGTLGKLSQDETLYKNLNQAVDNLNKLTEDIRLQPNESSNRHQPDQTLCLKVRWASFNHQYYNQPKSCIGQIHIPHSPHWELPGYGS